mmetsp:Transcript_53507/g.115625  ORF Transcript_53507/g.115625 Transcript_53507/m.115625 type:complete len:436 (+) Transcript_53507:91-1398(+)
MSASRYLAALWAWAAHFAVVHGTWLQGEFPANEPFGAYVGKFCFDYNTTDLAVVGSAEIKIDPLFPVDEGVIYLAIFDDERHRWKKIRKNWASRTCEERLSAANQYTEIWLNDTDLTRKTQIRQHIRPRFWYFTFLSCGKSFPTPLKYTVHLVNDSYGWQNEFSLDHMGLFTVYVVFSIAFSLMTLVTWCASCGDNGRREHPYIQLLLLSYVASTASCLFQLIHYTLFLLTGYGSMRIRFLGMLAAITANCTVFLIAILASMGWAISRTKLPNRRACLGAIAFVGALSAFCELHAEVAIDESSRLYSYQSAPGVMALMMKIFMFCWFGFQIKIAYEEEKDPRRQRFYKFLAVSFTIWAVNVPITVVLAFLVSPWWRYKVVTTVDILSRFLGQALLAQILCGPLSPITAENTFQAQQRVSFREAEDMQFSSDFLNS